MKLILLTALFLVILQNAQINCDDGDSDYPDLFITGAVAEDTTPPNYDDLFPSTSSKPRKSHNKATTTLKSVRKPLTTASPIDDTTWEDPEVIFNDYILSFNKFVINYN